MFFIFNNTIRLFHEYRWSRRKCLRFKCIDCGQNVIDIGDFCMVQHSIWKKFGLKFRDNLCIECIEARLGRKLRPADFMVGMLPWGSVRGYPPSLLLQQRRGPHPWLLRHEIHRRAERKKAIRRKRRLARSNALS